MILHDRYGNPIPVYCETRCKKKPDCRLKYRVQVTECENREVEKKHENQSLGSK